jgi:trimeric autotransporter adhesin
MIRLTEKLILALLLCSAASAQTFTGAMRGKVSDPQGAAISLARVTVKDEATQTSRATITSEAGEYAFPSLQPAKYSVLIEAPGFKRMERAGVEIATQSAVTIDVVMQLGDVTEQVNVTAETPLMETANASTGQVIEKQQLEDLPNLGRNPFMMSKLAQNVVPVGNPKFNRMQDQSGSSQISIAGGPVRGNNYLLDGISITDSVNRAVIIPSIESVQEVKVQANTYDAEMGRTGGGTFNTTLKSGSNRMHGSVLGYIRETEWLANNYFSNANRQPRIEQPFRNYGASIGGPVRIPKVYDGRNSTFFWISGEAYRQTEAAGTRLFVPTALERVGNFSNSQVTIFDPLTSQRNAAGAVVRTAFAGNVIPEARMSRVGRSLASYYPLPSAANATSRYGTDAFNATVGAYNRADQTTWKLDHTFNEKLRASTSYLHYGSREPGNAWFPNIASPNQGVLFRKVDATQANATFTPTPVWVVAVRYGFNRFPNRSVSTSDGFNITELGFPSSFASQLQTTYFPGVTMSDLTSYGGSSLSQNVYHSRSFSSSASRFLGRHTLRFGYDYRKLNHDGMPGITAGSWSFSDTFTRANPAQAQAGSGAALASMLLGYAASGSATVSTPMYNDVRYHAGFVQDDFRINSRLTLNMGLRYEWETGVGERDNSFISGFDAARANPLNGRVPGVTLNGAVMYAGLGNNPLRSGNPNRNKFSPRVGAAYQLNEKTTVRGGYGMFWAPIPFTLQDPIGFTQSTPFVASLDNNATPANTIDNPFPTGLLRPVGNAQGELAGIGQSISVYDIAARSTLVQQYSIDVQRQLAGSTVLAMGYVGSKSTNLVQGTGGLNLNQLDPSNFVLGLTALNQSVPNPFAGNGGAFNLAGASVARSQLLRPFPQYTGLTMINSDRNRALYHSFFARLQKRMSNGLNFQGTYTWSQNMDGSFGGAGNSLNGQPGGVQNLYNLDAEYGLATVHTPHRFVTSLTYELPFGKGRNWLGNNRAMDLAIGGWSINAVGTLQSGFPLAISQLNNNSTFGFGVQRPNATGQSSVAEGDFAARLDRWFNPAAFSLSPALSFGNVPRTLQQRGPGQVNWDVSVFKSFTLFEGWKAQFRAEALNFTNTPLFNGPNTSYGTPQFGRITSQANFSRMVQLGVRVSF